MDKTDTSLEKDRKSGWGRENRESGQNANETLLLNLEKLHTTEMGLVRISRNLSLDTDDVVQWCKEKIKSPDAVVIRKGKNWYVNTDNCIITVNAYSYTIITAHRGK